ncbi:MAG: histidine--tRNA ligase [bacterium]|nr:histidine--tRNA ligase [bacterium]
MNTKPLPGMMELLPEWQIEFDRILEIIKKNHARFGYSPIDTPVIERTETLLAKAGGETEKQIYRFNKGDNDLSLRFDLTVPTARYVAENFGQLQFPFKRSQIGKVYRGERSQRGRFREFYQCDIDVVGRDKLSVNYDAEVIAVIYSIFRELDFGKFTLRISNRKLSSGLISALNLKERSAEILALIDRAEKISQKEFSAKLTELDLGEGEDLIKKFIQISGDNSRVLTELRAISGLLVDKNNEFEEGIAELENVANLLQKMGVGEEFFKLDMSIVRGLDYYTGTVFETNLNEFREIGSIASGGRYDNLSEYYSKEKLPGVGASIGLTRLFWTLQNLEIVREQKRTTAEVLIIPMSQNEMEKSLEIAQKLRENGKNVETLLEISSIKKAFKFADKRGVEFVLVVGEKEVAENSFSLKNMKTGEVLPFENFINNLKN